MNAKEISSTECIAIFFRLLNASDDVNCRTVSVPGRQPLKGRRQITYGRLNMDLSAIRLFN